MKYLSNHLDSEPDELSLPKLIIFRRDVHGDNFREGDFLVKVKKTNLFEPQIVSMNISNPSSKSIKNK